MGINLDMNPNRTSFVGCVTVCDVPNCNEVATKYYIRGEDPEFWEMYRKSHYAKLEHWVRDRVYILGFCGSHSYYKVNKT